VKGIFSQTDARFPGTESSPRVGWTCTYIPIEILEAAGLRPVRVLPESGAEKADAYLDPNFCPYVKACLGKAMAGGYGDLEGIVIANSCDNMRRLYDAWHHYAPTPFVFLLDLPRVPTKKSVAYFSSQLRALIGQIEQHFEVKITDSSLREATARVNRTRSLFAEIFSCTAKLNSALKYSDVLNLLDKEYEVPRGALNEELGEIVRSLNNLAPERSPGPKVFITGSILDGASLIRLVEEIGGNIVGVDSCVAERRRQEIPVDGDMVRAIAESYLNKPPCARMKETENRVAFLLQRMRDTGAEGLIYAALKFCDPYLYEFVYLKEEFQQRGIPVLFLEREYGGRAGGALRTRLQAFLEMLSRGKRS